MRILKSITTVFSIFCLSTSLIAQTNSATSFSSIGDDDKNILIANDLGRNGYYLQKPIAEQMGKLAENIDIEFIAALGDIHHFDGVASVSDPLWMTKYELIYAHPELMIDWKSICGNHEYRGNTQAVLDYTDISRRWFAPAKYYSEIVELENGEKAVLLFIDTTPLITKYRKESDSYPDAIKQDNNKQLAWIDSTLNANKDAKWKIVMGHHPVYAQTKKSESERTDLQKQLIPIMEQNGVNSYICGHIHNFQHIKPKNSKIDYFVNSSGSLARKVEPLKDTKYCSPEAGFMLMSLSNKNITYYMINSDGNIIYKHISE
ncbi:MAG: metallophosphoesterase [Bacteroidales bacterium]